MRPNIIGYRLYKLYDSSGTLSQTVAGIFSSLLTEQIHD